MAHFVPNSQRILSELLLDVPDCIECVRALLMIEIHVLRANCGEGYVDSIILRDACLLHTIPRPVASLNVRTRLLSKCYAVH